MKRIDNLNQLREHLKEIVSLNDKEYLKQRGKKCYADTRYRYLIGNGLLDNKIEYEEFVEILDEEIAKSNKKVEYNARWTKENTKSTLIRFNRNDDVWQKIDVLKANGFKLNALFKQAIEQEYEQIKKGNH